MSIYITGVLAKGEESLPGLEVTPIYRFDEQFGTPQEKSGVLLTICTAVGDMTITLDAEGMKLLRDQIS